MIGLNKSSGPGPRRFWYYLTRVQGLIILTPKCIFSLWERLLLKWHIKLGKTSLWNKMHDPRFAGSGCLVLLNLKYCLVHWYPFQPPTPPSKPYRARARRLLRRLTPFNKSALCDDIKLKADRHVFLLADTWEWNDGLWGIQEYSLSVTGECLYSQKLIALTFSPLLWVNTSILLQKQQE